MVYMKEEEARKIFRKCAQNSHIARLATWTESNNDGEVNEEEYRKLLLDDISIENDISCFLEVVNSIGDNNS